MRDSFNRERQKRRQETRDYYLAKLGGKCVNCASSDDLQFDHVDKNTKTMRTSHLWDYASNVIEKELANCQLLCRPCHIEKSLKFSDYGQEGEHGTIWKYIKHRCRCSLCKRAMSAYYYARKVKKN